jgi:hypothetical protein
MRLPAPEVNPEETIASSIATGEPRHHRSGSRGRAFACGDAETPGPALAAQRLLPVLQPAVRLVAIHLDPQRRQLFRPAGPQVALTPGRRNRPLR